MVALAQRAFVLVGEPAEPMAPLELDGPAVERDGEAFSPEDLRLYRDNLAAATARFDQLDAAWKRYRDEGTRHKLDHEAERIADLALQIRKQEDLARKEAAHRAKRAEDEALRAAQMRLVA